MKQIKKQRGMGIAILFVMILFNTLAIHHSMAVFQAEPANLYEKGECGSLLKKDGVIIRTTLVVYQNQGKEYPAYCLNKEKDGVGECGSYTVNVAELISNALVWRAIVNGYPYQTVAELGCSNEQEAFMATKMAVYSALYGYQIEQFEAIGEAGERTRRALEKILTKMKDNSQVKNSPDITIQTKETTWKQEGQYITRTLKVASNNAMKGYQINIKAGKMEGMKMTNLQGVEKSNFSAGEEIKLWVPIQEITQNKNLEIEAEGEVNTHPVFIGKAPDATKQDYAITGDSFEMGKGKIQIPVPKNETSIHIKKQDMQTKHPIQGAEFQITNEKGEVLYTNLISNEKGEIYLENLLPGTYYLKETKSPEGYELYPEVIPVELGYGQTYTITVNNQKESNTPPTIEVHPEEKQKEVLVETVKKLPKTGM